MYKGESKHVLRKNNVTHQFARIVLPHELNIVHFFFVIGIAFFNFKTFFACNLDLQSAC